MTARCIKPLPDPFDEREPVNHCRCPVCAPTKAAVRRYSVEDDYSEVIEDGAVWVREADYIVTEAERVRLEARVAELESQLRYFVAAKRFDRDSFDDDTAMLDWILSRSRHLLAAAKPQGERT